MNRPASSPSSADEPARLPIGAASVATARQPQPTPPEGRKGWSRWLPKRLREHADAGKIAHFVLERAAAKKLTQVAASLTFTTVLSIVPMLAVVLALFTAFPLFADFRAALEQFFSASLMPPSVSDTVMLYLNQFAAKASGLTAVGSLFLFVTSIMLMMTVDETFNDIWEVQRRRPLRQRILVYWAIVSLGPILGGASLWATSVLARESMGYVGDLPSAIGFALSFIPVIISGFGFAALFMVVPNRRVHWKDALIGGFGTAIVLEIMKSGFAYYLTRFPSYTVIYGAFATLPIFLLWIYLSWLVILVGATVAAILPALRQRRWALNRQPGALFVDAMNVLHALWRAQGATPPGRSMGYLCSHLQMHQDELLEVLHALKRLGYAVNTQDKGGDADHWVLSCDQREATIGPVVEALLLDRSQPGLQKENGLPDAIALSLAGAPPRLADLFECPEALPQIRPLVHNTIDGAPGGRKETDHAQSQ